MAAQSRQAANDEQMFFPYRPAPPPSIGATRATPTTTETCAAPNENEFRRIYADWCREIERYKSAYRQWHAKQNVSLTQSAPRPPRTSFSLYAEPLVSAYSNNQIHQNKSPPLPNCGRETSSAASRSAPANSNEARCSSSTAIRSTSSRRNRNPTGSGHQARASGHSEQRQLSRRAHDLNRFSREPKASPTPHPPLISVADTATNSCLPPVRVRTAPSTSETQLTTRPLPEL